MSIRKSFVFCATILFFVGTSVAVAQNNPRAGQQSSVQTGVITSMKASTSQGEGSVGGTLAGGAVGGVLGNQVGGGSGKKVATVAGGLLGAKVGNKRSAERNTQQNVEFMIKLDNGKTISVVQSQAKATGFRKGDKVSVITATDGTTRLARG